MKSICKLCTELIKDHQVTYYGFCKSCWKTMRNDIYQDEIKDNEKATKHLYYINNKEKIKQWQRDYQKTPKGREVRSRTYAKRKRNLGFTPLFPNPFADDVPVHWHHYDDEFVVALPRDIHLMFLGNNHRENLNPIIHQIYL